MSPIVTQHYGKRFTGSVQEYIRTCIVGQLGILLFVSEEPQLLNPFQLVITDPDIEGANIANLVELDDDENVQVANYELHLRIALFYQLSVSCQN